MKFRKKSVVVDATQWFKNGDHPLDVCERGRGGLTEGFVVRYFRLPVKNRRSICEQCSGFMQDHGWIDTLEGGHIVCPGDWIITGVKGEHYPCKPDIFAATYERVAPKDSGTGAG